MAHFFLSKEEVEMWTTQAQAATERKMLHKRKVAPRRLPGSIVAALWNPILALKSLRYKNRLWSLWRLPHFIATTLLLDTSQMHWIQTGKALPNFRILPWFCVCSTPKKAFWSLFDQKIRKTIFPVLFVSSDWLSIWILRFNQKWNWHCLWTIFEHNLNAQVESESQNTWCFKNVKTSKFFQKTKLNFFAILTLWFSTMKCSRKPNSPSLIMQNCSFFFLLHMLSQCKIFALSCLTWIALKINNHSSGKFASFMRNGISKIENILVKLINFFCSNAITESLFLAQLKNQFASKI